MSDAAFQMPSRQALDASPSGSNEAKLRVDGARSMKTRSFASLLQASMLTCQRISVPSLLPVVQVSVVIASPRLGRTEDTFDILQASALPRRFAARRQTCVNQIADDLPHAFAVTSCSPTHGMVLLFL